MSDSPKPRDWRSYLPYLLPGLLLLTSLVSGYRARTGLNAEVAAWRSLDERQQRATLMRGYAPLIDHVGRNVPETEGLVLYSAIDPALLPYYLYPRKIWQTRVDPETNRQYMVLPPSVFPERAPESFGARWVVSFDQENAQRGGDLYRMGPREPRVPAAPEGR